MGEGEIDRGMIEGGSGAGARVGVGVGVGAVPGADIS